MVKTTESPKEEWKLKNSFTPHETFEPRHVSSIGNKGIFEFSQVVSVKVFQELWGQMERVQRLAIEKNGDWNMCCHIDEVCQVEGPGKQ
jgi:hypothetical protein